MAFETTLWSRINAAQIGEASAARTLVERYRSPLLGYLRLKGASDHDAEDLVQEVFLRLFARGLLERADRSRGRFRGYLLGIARNVLREAREHKGAQKRGGGLQRVPLDAIPEPVSEADPEFDGLWTQHLIQQALDGLELENARQFETLTLRIRQGLGHQEIAERMERTVAQVKVDLHRARQRLVRLIKTEIGRYASSQEEYDDEVGALLTAIGQRKS